MIQNSDNSSDDNNQKPINLSDWEQSSQKSINSLTDEEQKSLVHQLVPVIAEAEVLQIISQNPNLSKADLLKIIDAIIAKKNKKKHEEKKKKDDLAQESEEEEANVAEGMQKHDIINNRTPSISLIDRLMPAAVVNLFSKNKHTKGDHLDRVMSEIKEKKTHQPNNAHNNIHANIAKIESSLEEDHQYQYDKYAHSTYSNSTHTPVTPLTESRVKYEGMGMGQKFKV